MRQAGWVAARCARRAQLLYIRKMDLPAVLAPWLLPSSLRNQPSSPPMGFSAGLRQDKNTSPQWQDVSGSLLLQARACISSVTGSMQHGAESETQRADRLQPALAMAPQAVIAARAGSVSSHLCGRWALMQLAKARAHLGATSACVGLASSRWCDSGPVLPCLLSSALPLRISTLPRRAASASACASVATLAPAVSALGSSVTLRALRRTGTAHQPGLCHPTWARPEPWLWRLCLCPGS